MILAKGLLHVFYLKWFVVKDSPCSYQVCIYYDMFAVLDITCLLFYFI